MEILFTSAEIHKDRCCRCCKKHSTAHVKALYTIYLDADGLGDNPKTDLLAAFDKRYTIVQYLFGEARQV